MSEPRGLDRILDLQDLDVVIERLGARRAEIESGQDVARAREEMNAALDRVGELKLALDSVIKEQTRLENEVSSMEQKIDAEQKRLYDGSVANPKELESIQHEVTSIRTRKSRTEDEVLEQMERREGLEDQLPALEKELADARNRVADVEAATEKEAAMVDQDLVARRAEREALTPGFDEELLELYEDLRAAKRGVGAAALVDGVCQGCHQKLSPLELDRFKRSEGLRRCEYCRRILVPR